MSFNIKNATESDLSTIVDLLIADANQRHAISPALWPLVENPQQRLGEMVGKSLQQAGVLGKEFWLIAEDDERVLGISHGMILPIPPIYAGKSGIPGLILDDCFVVEDAPPNVEAELLLAMEAKLREAGAKMLLASCVAHGSTMAMLEQHAYRPVTLYMGKAGFGDVREAEGVRSATVEDVPNIVTASAKHRALLSQINERFWNIHEEADARFGRWMQRSLTFSDRDMFITDDADGYIIAQPIAPLLVPAAHDIAKIGVIDDFFHTDFANIAEVTGDGVGATNLLRTAQRAFAERNVDAAFVVCPAKWFSKIAILEKQGFQTAKVWLLKD